MKDKDSVINCYLLKFNIVYRWCPESLRWLLANGRVDECARILKTAAKVNGVSLPGEYNLVIEHWNVGNLTCFLRSSLHNYIGVTLRT